MPVTRKTEVRVTDALKHEPSHQQSHSAGRGGCVSCLWAEAGKGTVQAAAP